ncbi:MAG: ATP-dependent Clp protease proteolytic subunit [Methanothrix sp.]|nr:ATP-dependent Clp protease proteolytic subunit [Methanothrix sp.]
MLKKDVMYENRKDLYRKIEDDRKSKLLVYITGDRQNLETMIASDVLNFFLEHLDIIGSVPKISLYLYTRGGDTLASWSIANLIRQFCSDFEVIISSKAHSGGTLICLGANSIIMTKQATLGPIDPSVNTPLNPAIPGAPPTARVPVSVEAINGYIELANSIGINSATDLTTIMSILSTHVHPLVLGQVYRTRSQIRMLGKRLLSKHMNDDGKMEKILAFLCSESGSHDYTIFRQEARDDLGLKVEHPSVELYDVIKKIQDDISKELELTQTYYPAIKLAGQKTIDYEFRRALIESTNGGSHKFVSKGKLTKFQQPGVIAEEIRDDRTFEGWTYEHN